MILRALRFAWGDIKWLALRYWAGLKATVRGLPWFAAGCAWGSIVAANAEPVKIMLIRAVLP